MDNNICNENCPFCGATAEDVRGWARCSNEGCTLYDVGFTWDAWNKRAGAVKSQEITQAETMNSLAGAEAMRIARVIDKGDYVSARMDRKEDAIRHLYGSQLRIENPTRTTTITVVEKL